MKPDLKNPVLPTGCNPACPACSHRSISRDESLEQKQRFLHKTLSPWNELLEPVLSVPDSDRYAYRKKTVLHTAWTHDKWEFGMLHRDELVSIPHCPVHSPQINRITAMLSKSLPGPEQFPLTFYVQNDKQLTLIIKAKNYNASDWLTPDLEMELRHCGLEGLWVHCNPSAGRRLFEKTPRILVMGSAWSKDARAMQYGPRSFQQLIPELYHLSLETACHWLKPERSTAVVDLYSGTGNSLKYWLEQKAETIGVELGGEAVECARMNVPEAVILRGKCEERLPQLTQWAVQQRSREHEIVLYANPPRTGIDPPSLAWIIETLRPQRIAYLSCSAGTLSRNLHQLALGGYEVAALKPVDFFPLTRHVETLALLEQKS